MIPNPRSDRIIEVDDRLLCFGNLEAMRGLVPERRRSRLRVQPSPTNHCSRNSGSAEASPFPIGDTEAVAGKRTQTEIPIGRLMSGTPLALPVIVVHGKSDGPTMWINAATHGDEICGVEIIRRVLDAVDPKSVSGTIIAAPIVNVHGFNTGDRYLPDRRDLNRSFPGSARGSLASRIAHLFMTEIVSRCELGIDLHTGSDHRANHPQLRGDLDDERTLHLANLFGAPVAIHSRVRDGSLRGAAVAQGATCLLFEGGEAYRFDEEAIAIGTDGALRVLHSLGMIDELVPPAPAPRIARSSRWVRAARSGIVDCRLALGADVEKGEEVGVLRDPYGKTLARLKAPATGMLIGSSNTRSSTAVMPSCTSLLSSSRAIRQSPGRLRYWRHGYRRHPGEVPSRA